MLDTQVRVFDEVRKGRMKTFGKEEKIKHKKPAIKIGPGHYKVFSVFGGGDENDWYYFYFLFLKNIILNILGMKHFSEGDVLNEKISILEVINEKEHCHISKVIN